MTYYFDLKTLKFETDKPKEKYIKLPFPAVILGAGIMGLLFVMFLPLIGFVLTSYSLFKYLFTKSVKRY